MGIKNRRKRKLKIAMVVERFPPDLGGSGIRFSKIAERLSHRHEIDIITLGSPNIQDLMCTFNIHRFDADKLPVLTYHRINRVIGHSFSTFFQLLFRSYDVIDVDIWPLVPFFSTKIAQANTRTIVSWNVAWPLSFNKNINRISNLLARIISTLSTDNITVSDFARESLVKYLRMSPGKIKVIPNGIDTSFTKAKLKPKWGRLIFVGRFEPQKRLDLLLEAFKIVRKRINDIELHIIGGGPLRQQMMIASRNLSGLYVHDPIPADRRDELAYELSRSWVFASASEFETYGLSIAESMSLGLPVILTRTPYNAAINEFVKHGHNGLIVEHNQPRAIADAIERLYRDQQLWKKLSSNAKCSTLFHSWDEIANEVETVYQKSGRR